MDNQIIKGRNDSKVNKTQKAFLFIIQKAIRGDDRSPVTYPCCDDCSSIVTLASRHSILPLVVEHLLDADAASPGSVSLPDRTVIDAARMKVIHQAQRTADLGMLLSHLGKAELRPVIMKGAVCRELYPVPAARPSVDEDFLIPPDQAADYHRELTAYGFRTSLDDGAIADADEITYNSTECRMCVEVHKYPFTRDQKAYAHLNDWLEGAYSRAEEVRCGRYSLLTLCPTDHLMYMLFHVYKHFLHGGFGIRQVCDIGLFSERHIDKIDWDRVRSVCREAGIHRFCSALFAIAVRYLLGETPLTGVLDADAMASVDCLPLLEDIMDSGVYGTSTMSRMHSSTITLGAAEKALKSRNGGGSGAAGLLRTVFPPISYMRGAYPFVRKSPLLLPVGWAVRIFKYLKEHRRTRKLKTGDSPARSVRIGRDRVELMKLYGIV